jgi:LL-diaminopimelate aminotransferase
MPRYRKAAANWMQTRFNVTLDPESEVIALIGSKEGVAHLCMAYLDPGDLALVCDPCYPVHFNGVVLSGAEVYSIPLLAENKFIPELKKIPEEVAKKAKILFLNYPNNPTAAVIEDNSFIVEAIEFCKKYEILLVYDNAYSEVTFEGYTAPSIFQFEGAKDIALEFHSFSKTFNMAGWRVGWACGAREFLAPLEKFKSFLDYGVPTFIQLAAAAALEGPQDCVKEQNKIYQCRMEKMVQGLNKIGWKCERTKGTMYLWLKIPEKFQKTGSLDFAERLLKDTGLVVTPGVGFGKCGEGYIRVALVTHDKRFHDALLRLKEFIK